MHVILIKGEISWPILIINSNSVLNVLMPLLIKSPALLIKMDKSLSIAKRIIILITEEKSMPFLSLKEEERIMI
jgi:hypothetical protein